MINSRKLNVDTILAAAIVVVTVVATPRFLELVAACGHYIRQSDLATDYLKGVLWALFLWLSILLWPVSRSSRRCLLIGWGAKISMTLGLMLYYEQRYGLDAYTYFDDSRKATFSLARFSVVGHAAGTSNIVNLASLNQALIADSYHAQKVSFAMIGLLGIFLFYKSGVLLLRREDRRIFYLLAFFPGIVFWSSILGKEPVAFFAISLYVFGTVSWYVRRSYRYLVAVAAGILLGMMIRVWLGPIMAIPLVLLFLRAPGNRLVKLLLVAGSCALLVYSAEPMLQTFRIEAFEDVLATADRTTQGFVRSEGGSTQQLQVDLTTPAGALNFLPQAAFTALFRPLPGEVMNPFGLLAGMESALLLGLLMLAAVRTRLTELSQPLVLWSGSFVITWSLVNGIVSSANFGVGVRYKLQILPVLLGLLSYLARKRDPALDGSASAAPDPSAALPQAVTRLRDGAAVEESGL